ncbi:MAG: glycine cleavage system aminomethyltransferase GcvT [Nitrospirae bacterium]|nr:glycine cleavage system aminomethyltransferase GcvT [Nitrospirota bacterium]MBI5696894.1 glycine cleavage system aminomethyltransferase GcvT [Nitrospirota bacterium]
MKHTALYQKHKSLGAKFTGFHGWEMPLEYSGVVHEHEAVRKAAGLFDIGHMGLIEVGGSDSAAFLRRMLTFRAETLPVDRARYGFLLNERAGIIDDLMVYRLNEDRFLLCVNSGNADRDLEWLRGHARGFEAILVDDSPDTAILSLQGPASWDIAKKALGVDPASFKYHAFMNSTYSGTGYILSKTGYTGEKGFEIFIHNHTVEAIWDGLMEAGKEFGLVPCGLGARDTLRLEMGYLLHGDDADEETNPIEAGYEGAVDLGNTDFIGYDALVKARTEGVSRRLAGLVLKEKGVPRHGCKILAGGTEVGVVTSGNFSPMLKTGIALGYIKTGAPADGLTIDIHDRPHAAEVVGLPFYMKT